MQIAQQAQVSTSKTRPAIPGPRRAVASRPPRPRVLRPDASAGEAFRVIALSCLDRFRFGEQRLERTGDAEALHQVRVALRQLRSAFSVFAPLFPDERFAHARGELKWLSGALNEARDLDALIARLDKVPPPLQRARERACAEAGAALASPRAHRAVRELEVRLAAGSPDFADSAGPAAQPAERFAAEALERLRRELRAKGRKFRALDDGGLHELRIVTKKLRYASEFFAGLFPSDKAQRRSQRLVQALRLLQDRLGELQDIAVAPPLLARLEVPRASWPPLPARKPLRRSARTQFDAVREIKPFWR